MHGLDFILFSLCLHQFRLHMESKDWTILNNELEIVSKDAVVAEFKTISVYFQARTMENNENPPDSRFSAEILFIDRSNRSQKWCSLRHIVRFPNLTHLWQKFVQDMRRQETFLLLLLRASVNWDDNALNLIWSGRCYFKLCWKYRERNVNYHEELFSFLLIPYHTILGVAVSTTNIATNKSVLLCYHSFIGTGIATCFNPSGKASRNLTRMRHMLLKCFFDVDPYWLCIWTWIFFILYYYII
jgi:hypothetical protein